MFSILAISEKYLMLHLLKIMQTYIAMDNDDDNDDNHDTNGEDVNDNHDLAIHLAIQLSSPPILSLNFNAFRQRC